MSTSKFPLFGIAEQLEKASKLEGAKEIYQKALEVSTSKDGQRKVDNVMTASIPVAEIKKVAEESIERVEEKMRNNLKKIVKGKGLAIDVEVDKLQPFKEVQDIMPAIDHRDFQRMAVDIKERGVQVPLVILSDTFEIICGYNRWRAAKEADLDVVPAYLAYMERDAAIKYALKDNLNRRHLTMAEKTGLVRELLRRRGKRTVGRPKTAEAEKIKKAKEEGFPVTLREIADTVGVSERTVDKIAATCGISKPRAYSLEKIPMRFPEVRGDELEDLVDLIQKRLDLEVAKLNIEHNDKIRAELTFYIKWKED